MTCHILCLSKISRSKYQCQMQGNRYSGKWRSQMSHFSFLVKLTWRMIQKILHANTLYVPARWGGAQLHIWYSNQTPRSCHWCRRKTIHQFWHAMTKYLLIDPADIHQTSNSDLKCFINLFNILFEAILHSFNIINDSLNVQSFYWFFIWPHVKVNW